MNAKRRFGTFAACLLLIFFMPLAGGAAQVPGTNAAGGCWRVVPTPQVGSQDITLSDLATSSNGEAWALGSSGNGLQRSSLLLRWDGAQWSSMPGPTYTQTISKTYGLGALKVFAPNDVWAVGGINHNTGNFVSNYSSALVAHWDGRVWTTVLSDTVPGPLVAVDGTSSDDVWVAGSVQYFQTGGQPVIGHWDGRRWTDYSRYEDSYNPIFDVVALSKNNVWAVGYQVWHWDGSTLSSTSQQSLQLEGVAASGPNNVWAVGAGPTKPTSLRWDGSRWQELAIPSPSTQAYLHSVAALSPTDVWAVGHYEGGALIAHWDGNSWSSMPNPVPGFSSRLDKIVAANGELWAIGERVLSPQGTAYRSEPVLLRYTSTPCPGTGPQQPLNPPVPIPGTGSQEFITGKRASGIFLAYWLNHGGVLQQGYPISGIIGEQSELNGQIYSIQYFERAIFEYHPELRGTPYEVLLSQLGTFQYKQKYPNGAPNQRANRDPGTLSFPETGKKLGGSFLKYWQDHGGLQQNGFPLSDEFTEVSDLDGKPYTVQYFERAVFEWHPENAPPYNVLLSQLGRYRWDDKYVKGTPSGSAPRKIAESVVGGQLVGAGNYLAWPDSRDPSPVRQFIYAYDALQNREFPISPPLTAPNGLPLDTNGALVFWNRRDTDIFYLEGYDFRTNAPTRIEPPAQMDFRRVESFGIDSSWLYYFRSDFTSRLGLHAHNLATNEERRLLPPSAELGGMLADGGHLIGTRERSLGQSTERSLHMVGLDGQEVTIAEGIGGFTGYDISGDNVVYSFFTEISNQTTYLFNTRSGSRKVVTLGRASGPVINGDRIAWVRWPDLAQSEANGWSIELYSIQNGKTTTVVAGLPAMPRDLVILDGGTLAFTADIDLSTQGYDLYIVDLAR